jgi:hypothetical protein
MVKILKCFRLILTMVNIRSKDLIKVALCSLVLYFEAKVQNSNQPQVTVEIGYIP